MPRANLTVTIPEGIWIGDITRSYPDARVRILAALSSGETGVGLAEITAPGVGAVVDAMRAAESVTELELLQHSEDTVLVQFETTTPLLLLPVQDSGVPLEMPFVIRDGEAEWDIAAPQHRLSELGTQLDEFGVRYVVNRVDQQIEPEQLLTDRQLRLVEAAVERGYYDTPRGCSLTDLADHLGLAKSTCSEILHRAEERVMKRYLEDLHEPTVEPPHS